MALPARIDRKSHREQANKRCQAHRNFVRSHNCCVPGCAARPIEVAHVRNGTGGGIALKPSDRWCLSLCRDHHSEQHRIGEASFQKRYDIDMKALAQEFVKTSPHRKKVEDMA